MGLSPPFHCPADPGAQPMDTVIEGALSSRREQVVDRVTQDYDMFNPQVQLGAG